jgi:hypothetical protein
VFNEETQYDLNKNPDIKTHGILTFMANAGLIKTKQQLKKISSLCVSLTCIHMILKRLTGAVYLLLNEINIAGCRALSAFSNAPDKGERSTGVSGPDLELVPHGEVSRSQQAVRRPS